VATLLRVLELVVLRRWFATCDDDGRRTNTGRARGEVWGGDDDPMGLDQAWSGLNHRFGHSIWARLQGYFWLVQARLVSL